MIRRIVSIGLALLFSFLILGFSIMRTAGHTFGQEPTLISEEATEAGEMEMAEEATEAGEATESGERKEAGGADYYLPYPGILPDHPLYWLKMMRDRIWLLLTTDPLKKAEVLLLFADKRIGAAEVLIRGNKVDLGLTTATKAEKYLERAIDQEEVARGKGKETREFLEKIAKAALKHEEILVSMKEEAEEKEAIIEEMMVYPRGVWEKATAVSE